MPLNKPVKLKVSGKRDFVFPVSALYFLVVVAGLLSPFPVILTILAIVLFGAGWIPVILELSKSNKAELTSVIFTDGRVRLESDGKVTIEGFLVGQQWCTRWLAVLRFTDGGTTRSLVISAVQQRNSADFRRLHMWIRQGMNNSSDAEQLLGN